MTEVAVKNKIRFREKGKGLLEVDGFKFFHLCEKKCFGQHDGRKRLSWKRTHRIEVYGLVLLRET